MSGARPEGEGGGVVLCGVCFVLLRDVLMAATRGGGVVHMQAIWRTQSQTTHSPTPAHSKLLAYRTAGRQNGDHHSGVHGFHPPHAAKLLQRGRGPPAVGIHLPGTLTCASRFIAPDHAGYRLHSSALLFGTCPPLFPIVQVGESLATNAVAGINNNAGLR